MKQTDINRCKMTGEWFKHVRRKWRKPVNKARRVFLKKEQKRQEEQLMKVAQMIYDGVKSGSYSIENVAEAIMYIR